MAELLPGRLAVKMRAPHLLPSTKTALWVLDTPNMCGIGLLPIEYQRLADRGPFDKLRVNSGQRADGGRETRDEGRGMKPKVSNGVDRVGGL